MVSTWEAEGQKALVNSFRYGRWPDPFRNMVKRIDVLACEDTWQAMFEMYAIGVGNWFWSNIVPGPWEITRKTFTGGYKCGFYFGTKWRSPLDIVWRDARTSRALGEIVRPVTTGLFYIWAAGAVWDALSTWHSMQLAMEMCDLDQNVTLQRDGGGPMGIGHNEGAPAFATVMYDPKNRAQPNNMETAYPFGFCSWKAFAVGYFISQSATFTDCRVGITVNGEQLGIVEVEDVAPFEVVAWYTEVSGQSDSVVLQPWFENTGTNGGVLKGKYECTRFSCTIIPGDHPLEPASPLIPGPKPDEFCEAWKGKYLYKYFTENE